MPKATNVKEEYIILLSPKFDVEKYQKEREKLRSFVEKDFSKYSIKAEANDIKNLEKYTKLVRQQVKLNQEELKLSTLENKAEKEKQKLLSEQAKARKRIVDLQTAEIKKNDLQERIDKRKSKEEEKNKINYKGVLRSLVSGNIGGIASTLGKLSVYGGIAVSTLTGILKLVKSLYEQTTSLSNKLISGDSAFVDKGVRQIMATFGVGSSTATGISSVLGLMGIGTGDMATMTGGQMQLFTQLLAQWNEGISSIDSNKINAYNEYVQGFQKFMASEKLDLQIKFYKMLIDNGSLLNSVFKSFGGLISTFFDFLTSDIAQSSLRTIIYAVDLIAQIADIIIKVVKLTSPMLSFAFEVMNAILGGLNIIANFINDLFGWLMDIADKLGFDTSGFREFVDNSTNLGKDTLSSGNYLTTNQYYDTGNYGNVTITQTTTNNFAGSDTSTYAVANSRAQSAQTWLSRQLTDRIVR